MASPVSNQRPPQPPPQVTETSAPAGASRVGTPPRTAGAGGTSDTFAANGQPAPQYQDRQALGRTANGQNVVAGREAGDFYCEHALFSSNEFANQAGSSVARDGSASTRSKTVTATPSPSSDFSAGSASPSLRSPGSVTNSTRAPSRLPATCPKRFAAPGSNTIEAVVLKVKGFIGGSVLFKGLR